MSKLNTTPMLDFNEVSFSYRDGHQEILAIDNITMKLETGQHLAVIGHNGSGKSTFARLCNALELPDSGTIYISGITANTMEDVYKIRRLCGMVFQNPDDQIVASTLEEDVAFGPENLGLETEEIRRRVEQSLIRVGLLEQAKRPPHNLSGGQKQKLSIAGVLALKPRCIILDEATAMLDPQSSEELMDFIIELCQAENITLVNITHNMEEVLLSDEVMVMKDGTIILEGTPNKVFANADLLQKEALRLPFHLSVLDQLNQYFTPEEIAENFQEQDVVKLFAEKIKDNLSRQEVSKQPDKDSTKAENSANLGDLKDSVSKSPEKLIEVTDLSYSYNPKSQNSHLALKDINMEVYKGEKLLICGHTGSGKSTLITHFNGLNRPQEGDVKVAGLSTNDQENIPEIRNKVGLVFQYPEKQLFANTVYEDIAFGPIRQGLSEAEVDQRVRDVQALMKIDDELMERSPFDLSGGQQRRVAIAGILSMNPEVLILDEPAAGLDPASRESMLELVEELADRGKTIVMVTHNMEDASRLADRMLIMADGQILATGTPEEIYNNEEILEISRLNPPESLKFSRRLSEATGLNLAFYSESDAVEVLSPMLGEVKGE